jgi:hypothetical protein
MRHAGLRACHQAPAAAPHQLREGAWIQRPDTPAIRSLNYSLLPIARFRSENILALELDLPERTTCDFEPGVPEARAQVGGCLMK